MRDLSWVYNAYVIAFGGLLLLGGRAADVFGARRTFAVGFALFVGASLIAGLAWNAEALVVGRAAQGIGAALTVPPALAIVMRLFSGTDEFNQAMAIWGAAAPVGFAAGLLLGGVLSDVVSWRWIFLINVPIGLVVLTLTSRMLKTDEPAHARGFDIIGAILSTGALLVAVYAIVEAPKRGWGATLTIVLLAVSLALLVTFILWQTRAEQPLVPLGFFRSSNVSGANSLMVLTGAVWVPMFFIISLYLQDILRMSPTKAGLAFLPMTLLIVLIVLVFISRLVERYGYRVLSSLGLLASLVAMVWFAQISVDGSFLVNVLPASLFGGLGLGLTFVPVTIAGMSEAQPEEAGLASGMLSTGYQFGSALGLAALTAIYASRAGDATGQASGGQAVALTEGFADALYAGAGIAAVGLILALTVFRSPQPQ